MKETYYFLHDYHARHDFKIEKLLMEKGLEGIGAYWCIVEMLYENNGYLEFDYDGIAMALRTNKPLINDLIEKYKLFENDGTKIWSNSVLRRLEERRLKSEKARTSANNRWNKNANAMRTQCDGNAIKERKGKEKKVNIKAYVDFEKSTMTSWNSFCDKFPILSNIQEISDKRRLKLKKRFETKSFQDFQTILAAIEKQQFLLGKNDRGWKISFDWLIENDTNYLKVLENKYIQTVENKSRRLV